LPLPLIPEISLVVMHSPIFLLALLYFLFYLIGMNLQNPTLQFSDGVVEIGTDFKLNLAEEEFPVSEQVQFERPSHFFIFASLIDANYNQSV
jgi:hypothetical protein